MKEIRDCFHHDLSDIISLAICLRHITSKGEKAVKDSPIHNYVLSWGEVDLGYPSFIPSTREEILKTYEDHPVAIQELVHAKMIQRWHEFLHQLFEYILLNADKDEDITQNITQMSQQNVLSKFSFEPAEEKLKKIIKLLSVTVDDERKQKIKKHITVRNIWQHNNGIVRKNDLEKFGSDKIILLDEYGKEFEVRAEGKLNISYRELLQVNTDFREVSSILVSSDR